MAKNIAVGDQVQLTATFVKAPATRYDNAAHLEAFKFESGTGVVREVFANGFLAIDWENGHGSASIHPRHIKRAR